MTKLQRIPIDSGEHRAFGGDTGGMDVVTTDSGMVGRATFGRGWRWSEHVKPIAGTDSCQAAHMGYVVSGRIHVEMDDGTSDEYGPGDLLIAPAGHDAWTLGDEPCVMLDWQGVKDYAKA